MMFGQFVLTVTVCSGGLLVVCVMGSLLWSSVGKVRKAWGGLTRIRKQEPIFMHGRFSRGGRWKA